MNDLVLSNKDAQSAATREQRLLSPDIEGSKFHGFQQIKSDEIHDFNNYQAD